MKKRSAIIVAIVFMMIGFAAVSTSLIINGNANVSESNEDYSVIFTKASLDGEDVYSTAVDDTKKIITFTSKNLMKVGDTSTLTYEVTNNSANYDAEVKVTCTPENNKYTSITNTIDVENDIVPARNTAKGRVTITLNKTSLEEVSEEYTCSLEFNATERDELGENIQDPVSFTTDSWETIQKAVKIGNTSKYNVGDTKEINLTNFGTHTVRISNMSACTNGETSETACGFVVEFADIITKHTFNNTSTNVGGWKNSEIRTYVNGTIYNSLPSELQNAITSTKVISGHGSTSGETNFETQDKVYLISSKELYGTATVKDTLSTETKQLDYYKNKGVTLLKYTEAVKKYNLQDVNWWLRSATSDTTDFFLDVATKGVWTNGASTALNGISPAFRIG